jgi:hypothetical protein
MFFIVKRTVRRAMCTSVDYLVTRPGSTHTVQLATGLKQTAIVFLEADSDFCVADLIERSVHLHPRWQLLYREPAFLIDNCERMRNQMDRIKTRERKEEKSGSRLEIRRLRPELFGSSVGALLLSRAVTARP